MVEKNTAETNLSPEIPKPHKNFRNFWSFYEDFYSRAHAIEEECSQHTSNLNSLSDTCANLSTTSKDFKENAKNSISSLTNFKKNCLKTTISIIKESLENQKTIFSKISKYRKQIKNILEGLHLHPNLMQKYSESLAKINEIFLSIIPINPENLSKKVKKLYSEAPNEIIQLAEDDPKSVLESSRDCKYMIFVDDRNQMKSIDLDSLKSKILDFPEKTFGFSAQCCRVEENVFFYYGGYKNEYINSAFLINLDFSECTELPSSISLGRGGCISKNKQVYVFGGMNMSDLDVCLSFNLEDYVWKDAGVLPIPSSANTASLAYGKILVTGTQLLGLYEYQELTQSFSVVLGLDKGPKYLFENFLMTKQGALIEWQSENLNEHISYSVPWAILGGSLDVYCCFKRQNYIYFIDYYNKLYRIDVAKKRVESVPYKLP